MAKDEIWNYISGRKEEEVEKKVSENYTYMIGVIAEYVQLGGIQPLDDIIENIRKDVLKIVAPSADLIAAEENAENVEKVEVETTETTETAPVAEETTAEPVSE